MATENSRVRATEFLTAYILPRKPETDEQKTAFDKAVGYQAETYDALLDSVGAYAGIGGISSISNDGVSVSFSGGSASNSASMDQIAPMARAVLFSAGLLKQTIPYARKRP